MDVFHLLTMFALLIAAVVVAIFGNILGAIFLAVLWVGFTNNYSNSND